MRSIRAKNNLIAVSAGFKETAINTPRATDVSLLAAIGDVFGLERRRETNIDEATGREEADIIYNLGATSAATLNFEKAQPQHFAFLYAYGLGRCATTVAGAARIHRITPIPAEEDTHRSNPSFTAVQRFGTVGTERFTSMFVNSVTATFATDAFCKVVGECIGSGRHDNSVEQETISALPTVTSLTLTRAVTGTTAEERLAAIHQIRAEVTPGVWTEVAFSAVSAATPAVATITAPGAGATAIPYRVLYSPAGTAWATFPAQIVETPLRVSELRFWVGGRWDGTAFTGGRLMGGEINSIEHNIANNGAVEFRPGAGGAIASRYFRDGRTQTLALNREFRDHVIRNYMDRNELISARILAEGMLIEGAHNYGVELIFPRLGVLNAPVSVDGKRLAEAGDLTVLQDAMHGSVIVNVKNRQAGYAQ